MTAADEPERRDWLAAARERTGRSQEALAHHLGVSTKAVSYWERGVTMPRVDIRRDLAEAVGLTLDELSRRLGIAAAPEQASLNGNGNAFSAITDWLSMFVRAEQSAYAIWTLETHAFPALCQTAGYARAVELTGHRQFTSQQVDELVERRLARADALATAKYTALVPAHLLSANKGGPDVMAEQTAHLLALAARPNITLRVLDPEHITATPSSFTLLATAGPAADIATEIGVRGPSYAEGTTTATDYVRLFDHLESQALELEASRSAIARSADRFAAMATLQKGPTP